MSRRIVNVSCPVCNKLTKDMVQEGPDGTKFLHSEWPDVGRRASTQTAALLNRRRRREGGRSSRGLTLRLTFDLDDPQLKPPWVQREVECFCAKCGRLAVDIEALLRAVADYRDSGRRQTIPAHRVSAR